MPRNLIIRFCIMLALVLSLESCDAGAKSGEASTITGTIRVVGNEPITYVVLRTSNTGGKDVRERDYVITGPLVQELKRTFQGRIVTLEGKGCTSPTPQFAKCFKPAKIMVD